MKKTALLPLAVILVFAGFLFSCVPQQKATTGKKDLVKLDSQLVKHSDDLKKLDQKRQTKDDQNEIDSAANSRIKKFIDKTNAEIDTLRVKNSIIIRGVEISRDDWNKLKKALALTRTAEQRISQKISFLEDLINRNMVVKLDQDVLFEPGSYSVSPSVVSKMTNLFEPAALEIDRFTKKYPDFPLSLVITAKGYADGTTIGEGSSLYRDLKARLNLSGVEPDNKELNKELSRARAQSVKDLFEKFAATRSDNGIYLRNVLYLYEGKGENPPDPKVTDYKLNDPRRRIVLLFWSIFPD
jgi:outer membrane protein OmpA-like peptidoglycan-associated protein